MAVIDNIQNSKIAKPTVGRKLLCPLHEGKEQNSSIRSYICPLFKLVELQRKCSESMSAEFDSFIVLSVKQKF